MQEPTEPARKPHPGDIALWPDGEWATMREIERGEFAWKSDDYEVIDHVDIRRRREVGVLGEIF